MEVYGDCELLRRNHLLEFFKRRVACETALHRDKAVVENIHQLFPHLHTRIADRIHDAPPVRIAPEPRTFNETRFCDRLAGAARIGETGGTEHLHLDEFRDALTVIDNHFREGKRHVIQRSLKPLKVLCARANHCIPGAPVGQH